MPSATPSILQSYASEPAVHALLDACVGRLARRDCDSFQIDEMALRHIADWLRAALANEEPWLKNVDEQGRPKKLLKFGSNKAITQEADKAMLKAAQRLRSTSVKLIDRDEALVEMLEDGYYVVRLLTPAALDQESAEMQHCIGNGGYDEHLKTGRHEYFSLRDEAGRPHVTLEVKNGHVAQFQGKQNAFPIDKYRDLLIPFMKTRKWRVDIPAYRLGYVIDAHGEWHSIHKLPEDLEVVGDLDLKQTTLISLPKGLKVRGNLLLSQSDIKILPDGLWVGESLSLHYSDIEVLPENLTVGSNLFLGRTRIANLPETLVVGGYLDLIGTDIKTLPAVISVGGSLYLAETQISSLPDSLKVKGDLDIRRTAIRSLPENLVVNGTLDLSSNEISMLPENIYVGMEIIIKGTRIKHLPVSIPDTAIIRSNKGQMSAARFRQLHGNQAIVPDPTPNGRPIRSVY